MTLMAKDTFELLDDSGRALPGYMVAAGPEAVVIIHEALGLNEQIKKVARRVAAEGFTAFAVDLFDGHVTQDMATGFRVAQLMNWNTAIDVVRRSVRALSAVGDGAKVGVMGFSFGGGVALAAAAHIPEIAACVPFYGIPITERADLTRIACKVQGHFAKMDKQISKDRVDALEQKLAAAGVPAEIHRYQAEHQFFNETRKVTHSNYNSQHAWHRTIAFLKRELVDS
jgi:carboxymethylenebutenolidase